MVLYLVYSGFFFLLWEVDWILDDVSYLETFRKIVWLLGLKSVPLSLRPQFSNTQGGTFHPDQGESML